VRSFPRQHVLVLGARGLLGSSVVSVARHEPGGPASVAAPRIAWASGQTSRDIEDAVQSLHRRSGEDGWAIIWCAGVGVIGSDAAQLSAESDALQHVLDCTAGMGPGVVALSSSAGGVFGATLARPITESTPPAPISEYGLNKLRQERAVAAWARDTGGCAVIARISNLYGPGQSLTKPQGLISHLALSVLRRQPIGIYVSLDTIRDYVYVDDAARQILHLVSYADQLEPGTTHTQIVASMRSISIGGVLGEMRRVAGRDPCVVMARSPLADAQGTTLNFRSVVGPDLEPFRRTTLPTGIDRVLSDLRSRGAELALPT